MKIIKPNLSFTKCISWWHFNYFWNIWNQDGMIPFLSNALQLERCVPSVNWKYKKVLCIPSGAVFVMVEWWQITFEDSVLEAVLSCTPVCDKWHHFGSLTTTYAKLGGWPRISWNNTPVFQWIVQGFFDCYLSDLHCFLLLSLPSNVSVRREREQNIFFWYWCCFMSFFCI